MEEHNETIPKYYWFFVSVNSTGKCGVFFRKKAALMSMSLLKDTKNICKYSELRSLSVHSILRFLTIVCKDRSSVSSESKSKRHQLRIT